MLTAATTSSFTFKTSILKDPRLNYPKLRLEIIELAATMCNEAVGNDGLLPWLAIFQSSTQQFTRWYGC